jgi:phosphodiesterase/alkaline phosphatase D-like protein
MELLRAAVHPSIGDRTPPDRRWAVPQRALAALALLSLVVGIDVFEGASAGRPAPPAPVPAARLLPAHKGAPTLPLAAQGVVSAALGAAGAEYRVRHVAGGLEARSAAARLRVGFDSAGVHVRSGTTQVGLRVVAFGYGASLQSVGTVTPRVNANRVTYAHRGLSEWYANGPLGLEQGFTIARAPSSGKVTPLTLSMALSGNAHASVDAGGQSVTLAHAGAPSLRYGALVVTDARGRALRSWLELDAGRLLLRVDARGAHYPLRIDPLIQQGSKLTGGEEVGPAAFGNSVALSADGTTALVGGPGDRVGLGAVWVFTRSGSTWTQQAELTGGEEVGQGQFGYAVALSADGNTALIGGGKDNSSVGAAWVFTRSESIWTQQGPKLKAKGETGDGHFGCCAVALSSDGNTALIGGYADNGSVGAAWVFTRSKSTWSQQGSKLTGGGEVGKGRFGFAVALSGEGNTALIGGGADDGGVGAAWVFTRSGSTWTQLGSKLVGAEEAGSSQFGFTAALSSEGNTALIGGGADDGGVGAAWVFTRSGSTWSQQGPKLTGGEEVAEGHFGCCGVALSSEGNTALIGGSSDNGAVGGAWVFTRSGSTWEQQGPKLTGGGEVGAGGFGSSVALSANALHALIGGFNDNGGVGAAWPFVTTSQPPAVLTGVASGVTQTSGTLNATVNPEGEAVSDCRFEYGTSESYGSSIPCGELPGSGSSPVAVSAGVSGLKASMTYHFRISATNPIGTSLGADATFTTPASEPPTVVTGVASGVAQTSGTLNATVNPEGEAVSDCRFEYGTSESYGSSVPCGELPGSGSGPAAVSADVSGLAASTMYHFRVSATNPAGTSVGADATFTTTASEPPAVLTGVASGVAQTSGTLNATVNPEDESVSDCHFEYGTSESYGSSIPCSQMAGSGSGPVAVSADVSGLSPSTMYHFRISATNPAGTSVGADATFTTTASEPPAVLTGIASGVAQTSGTLNATVNPEDETVSDCHFEYGTSEAYGLIVPCSPPPGSGTSPVAVSSAVSGLSPSTTYHFRVVATNGTGTSLGADETFKTASPALPELGRCVALAKATGKYTTAACTTKSSGESSGKDEWVPWPAAKNGFTHKNTTATFETIDKSTVKCLENTLTGSYSGSQTATLTISFSGCEAHGGAGGKCQSEGAAPGEIVTHALEGQLGVIKAATVPSVGWDLKAASGPSLATFKCAATEISVTGSVIAPVTTVDKMLVTFALRFKASKGKQAPEKFESGINDTLSFVTAGTEQAGLTMTDSIVGEEEVEIKAIA